MEIINNSIAIIFILLVGIGIGITYKYVSANVRKSMQRKKALEKARLAKEVKKIVRDYLKELQK